MLYYELFTLFHSYETSNGIAAQEQGQLKEIGNESGIVVQGSYSYVGPDGQTYTVKYISDENGFQPTVSTDFEFLYVI